MIDYCQCLVNLIFKMRASLSASFTVPTDSGGIIMMEAMYYRYCLQNLVAQHSGSLAYLEAHTSTYMQIQEYRYMQIQMQ